MVLESRPFYNQSFTLHPLDPDDDTIVEVLELRKNGALLTHGTMLPGGFGRLTIVYPEMTWAEYQRWRLERLGFRLRVEDSTFTLIWQGRLEAVRIIESGDKLVMGELLFRGYWSNFTDAIDFGTYVAQTGQQILTTILTSEIDAATLQLSTSTARFTAVTASLSIDRDGLDRSCWDTIIDDDGILGHQDTGGKQVDLFVYEDREVSYVPRDPTVLDYRSFAREGGVKNFPDEVSIRDLANATYGRWNAGLNGAATDASSLAKYWRREKVFGSTALTNTGTAAIARNLGLEQSKEPRQRMRTLDIVEIYTDGGVLTPLCQIRAGKVLRVPDVLTLTSDVDAATLNAITTFMLISTTCVHAGSNISLQVAVDNSDRTLASLLKARR